MSGTGPSASSQTQSLGDGGTGATEGGSTGSLGVLIIEGTGKVSGTSGTTGPLTGDFFYDHLERLTCYYTVSIPSMGVNFWAMLRTMYRTVLGGQMWPSCVGEQAKEG